MVRNIILNFSIILPIALTSINAQDADPIEAARQAKLAAEKAAADAEAATGAAIEAAASRAAAEAREKVIADREAEKARKIAEQEAAENAEIDAAAEAAALEARRKLAAELGLEIEEVPDSSVDAQLNSLSNEENITDEGNSSLKGFNIGIAPSFGLVSGVTFTSIPYGGTAVITTPYGFDLGAFRYNISLVAGGFVGKYESLEDDEYLEENPEHTPWTTEFNPMLFGIGGNLTLSSFIFTEGHVGLIGEGPGFRGFAGISLERFTKNRLPFNLLAGSEIFISSDMAGSGSSGWISLGLRLDYNL